MSSGNVRGLTAIREMTQQLKDAFEPQVIEYLKVPPTREELAGMIRRSGLSARDFLRKKEKLYAELNLAEPKLSDAHIVDSLAQNPVLLNRPVVETPKGLRPCRPAESVLELLD